MAEAIKLSKARRHRADQVDTDLGRAYHDVGVMARYMPEHQVELRALAGRAIRALRDLHRLTHPTCSPEPGSIGFSGH